MRARAVSIVILGWLCSLLPSSGLAQNAGPASTPGVPDSRFGIRTVPILLLTRADVRADVGLTAEQGQAAEAAIQTFHKQALACVGRTGPAIILARKQIDESQTRWLREHLSETQLVRLLQIDLQWEGPSALVSRPSVSLALGLSPGQVELLRKKVKDASEKRADKGFTPADVIEFKKATYSILSIDQQDRWHAILGPQFVPQVADAKTVSQVKR
jgi:hypothetical protein